MKQRDGSEGISLTTVLTQCRRNKWESIISAYYYRKRAWLYVCINKYVLFLFNRNLFEIKLHPLILSLNILILLILIRTTSHSTITLYKSNKRTLTFFWRNRVKKLVIATANTKMRGHKRIGPVAKIDKILALTSSHDAARDCRLPTLIF